MLILFTNQYDVRMHLISLFVIANIEGEIDNRENIYWLQLLGEYEKS